MTAPEPMPLTLCHACDTVYAHAGQTSLEAMHNHAVEAHLDVLRDDPGGLTFTHLAESPRPLAPDLPRGSE